MKVLGKILNYKYKTGDELYSYIYYVLKLTYDDLYDLIKNSYIDHEYSIDTYRKLVVECKQYGNFIMNKIADESELLNEREQLEEADKFFSMYCAGNFLTIEDFLKKAKISNIEFLDYLDVLKRKKTKIYHEFMKEKERRDDKFKIILTEKLCEMTILLNNGINEKNEIRPFDIVDYYNLIGFPIDKVLAYLPLVCPSDKKKIISEFLNKYKNDETLESSFLYQLNLRYGCSYNEDGTVVKNSGHLFTDEQKKEMINYMNDNQDVLPYTEEVYKALCRRKRRLLEKSVK